MLPAEVSDFLLDFLVDVLLELFDVLFLAVVLPELFVVVLPDELDEDERTLVKMLPMSILSSIDVTIDFAEDDFDDDSSSVF